MTTNTQTAKKLDGTVEIPVTVPKARVDSAYQKLLHETTKNAEIKGFRKGKAPKNTVEKNIDKSAIYQKVLQSLLPDLLSTAIKTNNLKPISNPQLKTISMQEGHDWQFTLKIVEFPQFKLGKYKDHIRGALRASKIWVPGDEKASSTQPKTSPEPKTQNKQTLTDKRLKKVFDTLLEKIDVPVAKILIDEEVNRSLSKLLDQVQKLGLTIEQYLQSMGKNTDSLRKDYQKTAKTNLKLEFILHKIGDDLKIPVSEQEIQTMIDALPDEKTKQAYQKPAQKNYLKGVVRKRKTIDALMKLG